MADSLASPSPSLIMDLEVRQPGGWEPQEEQRLSVGSLGITLQVVEQDAFHAITTEDLPVPSQVRRIFPEDAILKGRGHEASPGNPSAVPPLSLGAECLIEVGKILEPQE